MEPSRILSDYGKLLEGDLPVGEVVIVAGASQPVSLIAQNKQDQQKVLANKPTEKPATKPLAKTPEKPAAKPTEKKIATKKSDSLLDTASPAKP